MLQGDIKLVNQADINGRVTKVIPFSITRRLDKDN